MCHPPVLAREAVVGASLVCDGTTAGGFERFGSGSGHRRSGRERRRKGRSPRHKPRSAAAQRKQRDGVQSRSAMDCARQEALSGRFQCGGVPAGSFLIEHPCAMSPDESSRGMFGGRRLAVDFQMMSSTYRTCWDARAMRAVGSSAAVVPVESMCEE